MNLGEWGNQVNFSNFYKWETVFVGYSFMIIKRSWGLVFSTTAKELPCNSERTISKMRGQVR